MRKFGTDAPKFMSFQLGDGETVYQLPLVHYLPVDVLVDMQRASEKGEAESLAFQVDLLARYMGDVAHSLTVGDVRAIYDAWNEESVSAGANAGE